MWSVWGTYLNVPKAIFYLRVRGVRFRAFAVLGLGFLGRVQAQDPLGFSGYIPDPKAKHPSSNLKARTVGSEPMPKH